MCCCNVPTPAVDGTIALSHTRLSGQISIAHIVTIPMGDMTSTAIIAMGPSATICSALAANIRGPVVIHRAKAVERGSCRWMYLVGSSTTLCSRHVATLFCTVKTWDVY